MPVQFVCQNCRQRLSISQRKRGAVVSCPKCGRENRVPEDDSAAGMAAMAGSAPDLAPLPEVIVYDDIPNLIAQHSDAPPSAAGGSAADALAAPVSKTPAWSSPAPGSTAPPVVTSGWAAPVSQSAADAPTSVQTAPRAADMVARLKSRQSDALLLITRRTVYAMSGLLFGLALAAFAAGFLIGRGQAPAGPEGEEQSVEVGADPVVLQGSLIYSDSPGHYKPDGDALVVALPVDKQPSQKMPSAGGSGEDAKDAGATDAVRALGGALLRSNSDGEFQLVAPRSGEYCLLLVSQHARRPTDKPIDSATLNELAGYFANPSQLIGDKKYVWLRQRLAGAPTPISHNFEADGK